MKNFIIYGKTFSLFRLKDLMHINSCKKPSSLNKYSRTGEELVPLIQTRKSTNLNNNYKIVNFNLWMMLLIIIYGCRKMIFNKATTTIYRARGILGLKGIHELDTTCRLNKFVYMMVTKGKRKIIIWKIKCEHTNWFEDWYDIFQAFTSRFTGDLGRTLKWTSTMKATKRLNGWAFSKLLTWRFKCSFYIKKIIKGAGTFLVKTLLVS